MENTAKNLFDVYVSRFENCYNPASPVKIKLIDWLQDNKHAEQVNKLRNITNKKERDGQKRKLPVITPSGVFSYRNFGSLITYSGFIQFDIDLKENKHIANFNELKVLLARISNIAYCGLSVSGKGYWGLVPVAYPQKHSAHFLALEKDFASLKIIIDHMPRSICSTRTYSVDAEAYFNPKATVYKRFFKSQKQLIKPFEKRFTDNSQTVSMEEETIKNLVKEIVKRQIDVTQGYQTWFEIACTLANVLGENGRIYFHEISQFHSDYHPVKTDKQYDACLKKRYNYTLGTLLHIVKLKAY